MKKLSLLLGTLGGGLAGYLFSNKKLREQLSSAKDAEEAARLLGQHMQDDGKKLAKQIQDFVESEDVQKNITKAKKYAKKTMDDAKKELDAALTTGKKKATTAAKKTAKKATSKAKKVTKKAVKKGKATAKKAKKRVKASVRKVS